MRSANKSHEDCDEAQLEDDCSNDRSAFSQEGEEDGGSFEGDDDEKDEINFDKLQGSDQKTFTASNPGDPAKRGLSERKEVTYSAYGTNLDNTVKLLSCSKNVTLIGKNDIK